MHKVDRNANIEFDSGDVTLFSLTAMIEGQLAHLNEIGSRLDHVADRLQIIPVAGADAPFTNQKQSADLREKMASSLDTLSYLVQTLNNTCNRLERVIGD